MRPTYAKIFTENLKHNISEIRSKTASGVKLCVAVKADAYGHGAVQCSKILESVGVDYLAVACISEGVELRKGGIKLPILVLSLCDESETDELVDNDLTPLVFDEEYVHLIAESAKKAGKEHYPVHLAVDTGMGRIGVYPDEAGIMAKKIVETGCLSLGGMCTHFAVSDSVKKADRAYTVKQFIRFNFAVESVRALGIDPGIRHCCNSAASLDIPEMHLDMVRSGITAYGYYPGDLDREYFEKKGSPVDLKPVMALVTKVVSVRPFEEGMSVSYGHTWTSHKHTTLGVLPVGYADGLFRRFAGKISVTIEGRQYPVRGRICMDQCMIEIEKNDVKRWSEAVIFGPVESGAFQSAQELADMTDTISYEITSAITSRVPRIYL